MLKNIYHLTTQRTWLNAEKEGELVDASLQSEGFIHCAYAGQLVTAANRFYSGNTELLILEIDRDKTRCEIKDEASSASGIIYPHIYGAILLQSVTAVFDFTYDQNSMFLLPPQLNG